MKSIFQSFLLFIVVSLIIVNFQNCSDLNSLANQESVTENKSGSTSTIGGNGEPYGGKIKYLAFMEGFLCDNMPAPYSIIEKVDNVYKLVQQACEVRNEVINNNSMKIEDINGTKAIYDFRYFYKELSPPDILLPQFNFDESYCTETMESQLIRAYGTAALSPEQMNTAIVDKLEFKIGSTFLGDRKADIVLVKGAPVVMNYPAQVQTQRLAIIISNTLIGSSSASYESSDKKLVIFIHRNENIPISLKANYEGTLSLITSEETLSNVKVSCPIYPHF